MQHIERVAHACLAPTIVWKHDASTIFTLALSLCAFVCLIIECESGPEALADQGNASLLALDIELFVALLFAATTILVWKLSNLSGTQRSAHAGGLGESVCRHGRSYIILSLVWSFRWGSCLTCIRPS